MIRAEVHSDDRNVQRSFDAEPYFQQASDQTLVELARCGWGGDYPADEVALWAADENPDVAQVFSYLEIIAGDRSKKNCCGFECHIDREDAHAWVQMNRPGAYLLILEYVE